MSTEVENLPSANKRQKLEESEENGPEAVLSEKDDISRANNDTKEEEGKDVPKTNGINIINNVIKENDWMASVTNGQDKFELARKGWENAQDFDGMLKILIYMTVTKRKLRKCRD